MSQQKIIAILELRLVREIRKKRERETTEEGLCYLFCFSNSPFFFFFLFEIFFFLLICCSFGFVSR